jgi:hypothetical protein
VASKKKERALTHRQQELIKGITAGKTLTQAALDAGYSPRNPGQSGYQALQNVQDQVRGIMDRHGLSDDQLIEKHLIRHLNATETKFFPYRTRIRKKTVQQIDHRKVDALTIQLGALDMAFRLRGSYAPKQFDFEPAASQGVRVIDVSAIPDHG